MDGQEAKTDVFETQYGLCLWLSLGQQGGEVGRDHITDPWSLCSATSNKQVSSLN